MMISKYSFTKYPHLLKEWHPSKNGNLTPYDIMPKTSKRYGGCVATNILGKRQLAKELQEDSPVLTVQK